MPQFAQFIAIRDNLFIIPDPVTGLNDAHIQDIHFADLDATRTAIMAFRIKAKGTVRLTMRFNSNGHFIDYKFDPPEPASTRPRSWHEVFDGKDLMAKNNELTIAVSGEGSVELSDVVVLYHAKTPD